MSDPDKKSKDDRNEKLEGNEKPLGETSQTPAEKITGENVPEATSLPANDEKEQLPPALAANKSVESIEAQDKEKKIGENDLSVNKSALRLSADRNSGETKKRWGINRNSADKKKLKETPRNSVDKKKQKETPRNSVDKKKLKETPVNSSDKENLMESPRNSGDKEKPREASVLKSKSNEGINEPPSGAKKVSPSPSNNSVTLKRQEESMALSKPRSSGDSSKKSDRSSKSRSSEWSFKSALGNTDTVAAVDHIKCPIMQEYYDIMETIKRQNSNLEQIKRDMLCTSASRERETLEKLYCTEEDKLNEELSKAMALQAQCPYERWPEIPVVTNIFDEVFFVDMDNLVNATRQRLSVLERSVKKTAIEEEMENDQNKANAEDHAKCTHLSSCTSEKLCRIPPKITSTCDAGESLKNLLDKIDNMEKVQFGRELHCFNKGGLNDLIVYLVKKRKKHLKNCQQCGPSSPNCPRMVSICDELCWVCKLKLKQLTAGESDSCRGKTENSNLKNLPIPCKSKLNSTQCAAKLPYNDCNADDHPNLPMLNEKQENEEFSCENDQLTPIYPMKQQIDSFSCENFTPPSKCLMKQVPSDCLMRQECNTCCVPKKQPCGACGCRTAQMLSLFESMATDLKQLKGNYSSRGCVSETDAGLVYETHQLKQELEDLKAEKEEFKLILKEQEAQMEDYRQRYMKAKQNVEEQMTKIKQLEKSNENIEEQISCEMEKIKSKYDQRVKELPQLLEEETNKLKQCCKENEELKEKLTVVCDELYKLKEQNKNFVAAASEDQRLEISKLKADLQAAREECKKSEDTSSLQKGDIKCLKSELTALRQETASIICRAKERAERQKASANKKIHELEDDLVKARAHACCAKMEKEKTMKQLDNVICNCQSTQAKVRTLQIYIKSLLEQLNSHACHRNSCWHKDHSCRN